MKNLIVFSLIVFSTVACKAQSTYYGSDSYNDGYVANAFPDDLTDWHLEARIRISNGISSGLITNRESNRLYDELERIERKEYFYQEDGNFSAWEQDEIWDDVINFNRNLGYQLTDSDRIRFGYDIRGFNRVGYGPWFYSGGFNFYRFDNWGYGNRRYGYIIPRNAWSYRYDHRGRSNHYSNRYNNNRNNNNREYRNNEYRTNKPRSIDRSNDSYNRGNDYGRVGSRQSDDNQNRTSSSRRQENSRPNDSATRGNSREFDNRSSSERGSMSGTRPSTRANPNSESRNERRSESVAPSRNSRTEGSGSSQRSSDSGQRNTRRN